MKLSRSELLDEADREFGGSPRYWYALLSTTMHNQDVAEALIQRIMDRHKATQQTTA